jgi:hypothetical protein
MNVRPETLTQDAVTDRKETAIRHVVTDKKEAVNRHAVIDQTETVNRHEVTVRQEPLHQAADRSHVVGQKAAHQKSQPVHLTAVQHQNVPKAAFLADQDQQEDADDKKLRIKNS